jgi:hypothetical protein
MGTGSNEVTTLRHYIRSIDGSQVASILNSSDSSLLPAEISVREKIRVGSNEFSYRRVYLLNHMYKVGWVVDYDIDFCMLCGKDFSWFKGRAKHHCRACGLLVCYKCSPHVSEVPYLGEEKESRVCRSCFGIKPGVMTPQQKNDMIEELVKTVEEEEKFVLLHREEQEQLLQRSIQRVNSLSLQKASSLKLTQSVTNESLLQRSLSTNRSNLSQHSLSPAPNLSSTRVALFQTPDDSSVTNRNSFHAGSSRRAVSTHKRQSHKQTADDSMLDLYEKEMRRWEEQQRPLYEEANRMMRELIPLDIYKSSMRRLVDQGVPILAANRIWNTKILWLICTHRDDIVKIHLADFRSKYAYDGLDIIEMRGIWYNLPEWDLYSSNPLEKGKAEWKDGFKAKLDEMSYKEAKGSLPPHFCRHPAYDDCTLLHIFDPEVELRPRFHRSASYRNQAIESPMDASRPLTKEEEEDLIWRASIAATSPQPGQSIQDRKKAYMDNFRDEDDDNDNGKRRKYQGFLNEINGEEEEDDDDAYALEDDISSLGLESNVASEANTPSYHNHGPRVANRLDLTLNSITTIPEMTTPESMSSLDRMSRQIKESSSPAPSPKHRKQPRSQLLQQARPLSSASGPGQKKAANRKASKNARSSKAVGEEAEESEDEISKARAREEFLASRRAMNAIAPAPDSSSVASTGSNNSNSVSTGISGGKQPQRVDMVVSQSTADAPTNETSRNSSFSTTTSVQSRSNNSLSQPFPPLQKSISFGTVSYSQQSNSLQSHKSRDPSPLPLLRHQPLAPVASSVPSAVENVTLKEDAVGRRPFLPLTRNHTQVIDDKDVTNNKKNDMGEDSDEDNGKGMIETRTPAFFSPDDSVVPFSAGGDTFRTVESEDNSLSTPITPSSAQSYKFLSHSKKFAVNIDDSPSVLLNTQQKRSQQRLLSQRSVERARQHATLPGGSRTPTDVLSTAAEKIKVATRVRDDLYQPGSDDRSYRRASTGPNTPTVPVEPIVESFHESDYGADSDQLVNDQDGLSPVISPMSASSSQQPSADNSNTLMRADIMRALFEEDTETVYECLGDEPITSIFQSPADKVLLGRIYWQCLLMQRYQTVLFLIDEAVIEIDAICEDAGAQAEQDGRSALHYAVMENAESFGRQLIRRGASIFLRDHEGESPLSRSLKQRIAWLLEEFQQSGEEDVLADHGNDEDKFQYISHFILTGVPDKTKKLLASNKFIISVSQATTLLNACKGSFEQMEDPVETFELLMSLGAEMAD